MIGVVHCKWQSEKRENKGVPDREADDIVIVDLFALNQAPFIDKRLLGWFDEGRIAYLKVHFNDIDPIVVFQDVSGERNVAHGFHRVETAYRLGITSIGAFMKPGSKWDAANFPDLETRSPWSEL
jgi:hypothetical protein